MNRSSLLAAVAASGLLVAPTAALADSTLVAGPLKVKGYAVSLTATDGAADSLSVVASKTSGPSTQMHMWSFKGVNVSIKGAKATLKGSLGRYGAINAKLTAGRSAKGVVPAGCTGSAGTARSGMLTGKTKLVLDTGFFKTVAPKSLKAQILKAGKLDCTGGSGSTTGLMLTSSLEQQEGQLMVSVSKSGGKVNQSVMRMDAGSATAPATVMHMITAKAGESGLTASPDLSSASAKGAGGFLTGALQFTGEPMGTMAAGSVSGDLVARFDSIGTQTLPAGTDAMLMQR